MKLRPILFKGEMVNAILAGRKTQTRRLMKVQPPANTDQIEYKIATTMSSTSAKDEGKHHWLGIDRTLDYNVLDATQPYFNCPISVGDILWVRETWYAGYVVKESGGLEEEITYWYRADTPSDARPGDVSEDWCIHEFGSENKECWPRWKSSMFMPREACRLFLKVTGVRVERLNDISEADAVAEGVDPQGPIGNIAVVERMGKARYQYANLWERINGKGAWEANPYVWVYEFSITDKPA